MKRRVIVFGLAVLIVGIITAVYVWRSFDQALYTPVMVSAGENLGAPQTPPSQSGEEDYWQDKPDIKLHHFAIGEGPKALPRPF